MNKMLTVILSSVLLFGCRTVVEDISRSSSFESTIGKGKETMRICYLYDMDNDGVFEIWDSIHSYGQGLDEKEKIIVHTVKPIEVIPVGTKLDVDKIEREYGKGMVGVTAHGTIHLEGGSVPFTYGIGIYDKYKEAPWVSSIYEPSKFMNIEPVETLNDEAAPRH